MIERLLCGFWVFVHFASKSNRSRVQFFPQPFLLPGDRPVQDRVSREPKGMGSWEVRDTGSGVLMGTARH